MADSLQRSCVPIHGYPILFSFFFFLWLGLRAMRLVTVTYYFIFFGSVCGCRSRGAVCWCVGLCVVVAGRVDVLCTLSTHGLYRGSSLMVWHLMNVALCVGIA
jgi:hypothetical protein